MSRLAKVMETFPYETPLISFFPDAAFDIPGEIIKDRKVQ